jgi:uncharacterized membrane protein
MKPSRKVLISAAVCGLISMAAHAQGAKPAPADAGAKGECHGVNACKGKGDCHGAGNSCKGTNACKGKGWNMMNKAECDKAKGTFKGAEQPKK